MTGLDEALKIAKEFIENSKQTDGGWELEEAALDNGKRVWNITYSFLKGNEILTAPLESATKIFSELLSQRKRRLYRTVKIDVKTGQVLEMKAGFAERQPEAA